MKDEKVRTGPDQWGLTSKGAYALGTGIVMLPVLEGVAHMGPLGLVLAAGATLVAYRHGNEIVSSGRGILRETVKVPTSRGIGDRLLGRQPNRKAIETRRARSSQGSSDATILIGHDRRGKEVRRTLDELQSILILALPGQGKSSAASSILAQVIEQGVRIAVIDRHARSSGSLSAMLSPFEAAFTKQPAYEQDSMIETLDYAENVLNDRMKEGDEDGIPLILVVDEMTNLLKKLGQKSEWGRVADKLSDVVESWNEMGRKYNCFTLCIGQLTNASRTGGTEIRELFTTRLIGGMQESQARLVLPKEVAGIASSLEKGEFIADFEGKETPFQVKVPQLSKRDIQRIVASIERDPLEELAEMEDIDPDDSRYGGDDEDLPPAAKQTPVIPEKGHMAEDIDLDLAVLVWNAGKNTVSKLMKTFKLTNHQAQKLRKMILEQADANPEEGN